MGNAILDLSNLINNLNEKDSLEFESAVDSLDTYLTEECGLTIEQQNQVYLLKGKLIEVCNNESFLRGFRVAQSLLLGGLYTEKFQNLGILKAD